MRVEPFHIYSGSTLVGTSALENGDVPMGVVFGEFKPADGYVVIQAKCQSGRDDQACLDLSVKTAAGMTIPCAGISISDDSSVPGQRCIEVSVLGVPHPLYQELFPDHAQMYARRFD